VPIDDALRARAMRGHNELAHDGMRVLGVAFRILTEPPAAGPSGVERDLVFVGLAGMNDPPRPEVKEAVATCRRAGIRPVMITGDHPLTARYVAAQIGIDGQGTAVVTGQEVARMSDDQLQATAASTTVFARVSPEHKLRIVQALQAQGQVVAMTGDGVNDAPALRRADIGVAMGISGTEVSKEAADMVLVDDNFATIVSAVEEGRVIYDNIRKFIKYLLTSNTGELWVMLLAPLLGMPLPLLPLQILWINLVTDGLPALALSVEPAEALTMRRAPVSPAENILGRGLLWQILWGGLVVGLAPLGMGYYFLTTGDADWQTMVFTTLTLSQLAFVLAVRSSRDSFFRIGALTNTPLVLTVAVTFVLQLMVIYVPYCQDLLKTRPLTAVELCVSLAVATLPFWAEEGYKWFRRSRLH
jgi:Ca2+-transporting ATPase